MSVGGKKKKKKNEATSVASPRSQKKTDDNYKNKNQETKHELPDEILVKTWEID